MKYLYKGMGIPGWGEISGSVLLGWHEKVRCLFIWVKTVREAGETNKKNVKEMIANYYLSLILLFFAVNRGCRSGMYCSCNDRSKNRVKYKELGIFNFSQTFLKGGTCNAKRKSAFYVLSELLIQNYS